MTYGTKQFDNGSIRGYLHFKTGKKIVLNEKEIQELEQKIKGWQYIAVEKFKTDACQ